MRGTAIVRIEVADDPGVRETLAGLIEIERPVGDAAADRVTMPEKPVLVTLIVGVAVEPTLILVTGDTDTVKWLPTFTITVAVFDTELPVAVTVIVYAPVAVVENVVTESCEFEGVDPTTVSVGGANDVVGHPSAHGEAVADRLTVPLNPVVPVTCMLKRAT